jgi:hypothetical protein
MADVRREGDGRTNTPSTRPLWQIKRISASAWCATKRILLLVAEAAMTKLLLLALPGTKTRVADEHAEALVPHPSVVFT